MHYRLDKRNAEKEAVKADALNMGINAAQYPYFICMNYFHRLLKFLACSRW